MSVIAVKVLKDRIEIAADSIIARGWTQTKSGNKFSKIAHLGEIIIGSAGDADEAILFQLFASKRKPEGNKSLDILNYMSEFSDWKNKKTDNGILSNSNIIVFDGKAFHVERYFVDEILNYEAIGAGMDYALAALYLGQGVEKAVETACELSVFCEAPIVKYEMDRT